MHNIFNEVFGDFFNGDDSHLSASDKTQASEAAEKFCGNNEDARKQFIGTFLTARKERNMAAAGVVN